MKIGGGAVINLCSSAYNYPKEFYKNMESNVIIDTTDPTQFYITPDQYAYTTGPLKEFTLEMVNCDAPQDGRIYLEDNMSYDLLKIICDNYGVSVYDKYDKLFNIHNEEYLCITYDGNNLFGYRSENLKKENMTQMTLKSMQILPYQILFWTTGKDAIPFRLFRVSNKFNDIYYAK